MEVYVWTYGEDEYGRNVYHTSEKPMWMGTCYSNDIESEEIEVT